MPLDILGRTRATMACAESLFEVRLRRTGCLVFALGQTSVEIGRKVTGCYVSRETEPEKVRQS